MRTGTRWRALLAFLLLLPVIEVVGIVAAARWVGLAPTVLALAALSVVGIVVVKRSSRRALSDLRAASREQRAPSRAVSDRILTLVGGLLLVVPGFVSALLSVPFFLPFTRPILRHGASGWAVRRGSMFVSSSLRSPTGPPRDPGHRVVHGEIVDES